MNRLGPLLMQRLDQLLEFVDFNSNIELDYLQIARCLEGMRLRCCQLDHDLQRVQEQLHQSESERLVLEVKLKHARNQAEVEMKKRHRAEAELEKQERKLKLIYDYLIADPQTSSLSEDQCSTALPVFDRPCFSHSTLLPGKCCVPGDILSAVQELGTSILSDISYGHSDDEISSQAKGMQVVKSGVTADNRGSAGHSLIPIAATSHRCSQANRWPSVNSDLTTIWGSTNDSAGGSSQAERDTFDTETRPEQRGVQDPFTAPPPQGTSTLQQHHFTSKMVIRVEYCAICKSRLRFGKIAFRCRPCQLLVHPECKEHCQTLCTPSARPRAREGILDDFAPPTPPLVPPIVVQCVNQVEKRGLQETGLYKVPGAEHLVHEWKNKLLSARRALPSLDHVVDVNVICDILKHFLRSLKEPLVTFYLHSAFLHAAEIPDESARHTALCQAVMKLPLANRDTLAFLMLHLQRIIQSPECHMDQHNLAQIFGPILVGHSTPNPTPLRIMEETPRQHLVVSHLLALPLKFWKRFVGEEQENLVPSVKQTNGVNEQEWLSCPLSSPKINAPIQMSPGSGCLPSKLCDCIGTTFPPLKSPVSGLMSSQNRARCVI